MVHDVVVHVVIHVYDKDLHLSSPIDGICWSPARMRTGSAGFIPHQHPAKGQQKSWSEVARVRQCPVHGHPRLEANYLRDTPFVRQTQTRGHGQKKTAFFLVPLWPHKRESRARVATSWTLFL